MSRPLVLYDLAASPNNIKVRLALAYKKIPYEKVAVDPQERGPVIKVSGQPLTPVLLHGDKVVYDSYAITRYLDANWPSTPRLYSVDRETMKKIEEWEGFARTDAGPPVGMMFGQFFAPALDADTVRRANERINRAASRIEEALSGSSFLMGEAPMAPDFAIGPLLFYGDLPDAFAQKNPIAGFFREHLRIDGVPKTRDWITRVMAWDR